MASLREIFGLASTASYLRGNVLSFNNVRLRQVSEGLSAGFGLPSSDGDTLFYYYQADETLTNTVGFGDTSYYALYELDVKAIIDSYLPSETELNRKTLTVATHAIVWAYALNSSADLADVSKAIGKTLINVAQFANNNQPFTVLKDGTVIQPFSPAVIARLINKDYAASTRQLATSAKTTQIDLANYNWFNVSKLFATPELQIMKDVENQYYYISGVFKYQAQQDILPDCIEDIVDLNTANGVKRTTFIRNIPCKQNGSYVGPAQTLTFNRVFNDGPSSSGDFTKAVKDAYISFEKNILPESDWSANANQILSHNLDSNGNYLPLSQVPPFSDANGRYSIPTEMSVAPDTMECVVQPQRMHIGDEYPRRFGVYDEHQHCVGWTTQNVTGFKYVSLELPETGWNQQLSYHKMNPVAATGNIFKRALNIDANPYLATESEGFYYPLNIIQEPYSEQWYFGPPQLNGRNTLPTLAFYQHFDSMSFNDNMKVVLFPCLSSSAGNLSGDSARSYSVSPIILTSGVSFSHFPYNNPSGKVKFSTGISSNLAGYDDVTRKFFGMGDAFAGQYTFTTFAASNAGFVYTGYESDVSGVIVDINDLLWDYSGHILGSPIKTMKYINGFVGPNGNLNMSKLVGQDISGNPKQYYYLDARTSSDISVETGVWDWFAPIPSDMNNLYIKNYTEQTVENYLPRYEQGPFAVYNESFLYPNAADMTAKYVGKLNGFPNTVTFDVELREEAIREIYATFRINPDGTITNSPTYRKPIRANAEGVADTSSTPLMYNIFIPNDPYTQNVFNFENWEASPEAEFEYVAPLPVVDKYWSPMTFASGATHYTFYTTPSGRNNNTYNGTTSLAGIGDGYLFKNGVLQTGNGANWHGIWTGSGYLAKTVFDENPRNIGLFHGYKALSKTVTLTYTPPIFDLGSGEMVVSDGLQSAFPEVVQTNGYYCENTDHIISQVSTGQDPLFNEIVGGRLGGLSAASQGGCHSHGIVGDKWNGFIYKNYGTTLYRCYVGYGYYTIPYRQTDADYQALLFDVSPTGSTIWLKNMAFYPFFQEHQDNKFQSNHSIPYVFEGTSGFLPTTYKNNKVSFDISNFFPMKTGTGWYAPNGLIIGPFDRDVSIGIDNQHQLFANSELYVNGQQLTRRQYRDDCPYDYLNSMYVGTGIVANEYGRNPDFTIFASAKAGKYLKVNVLARVLGMDGDPTGVGLDEGAIVSIQYLPTRFGSKWDANLYDGEEGWSDPYRYTSGILPTPIHINNSDFESLEGTYSVPSFSRSGLYYPIPDYDDFTGYGTADVWGNISYPASYNVEDYWKKKARASHKPITLSGWREGSRLSIKIKNLKIAFDTIPYQHRQVVVPSGKCLISGEMGYYAQADTSVFSAGVILANITNPDPLSSLYNPTFMSDVLQRLAMYVLPSGSGLVLAAPSVMKQRTFESGLYDEQTYQGVLTDAPYNYNKMLWPALSDLEHLNAGETIEQIPADDGFTYMNSNLIFSAAQGQLLPNGENNPNVNKAYGVVAAYQLYDSTATDAIINSGVCVTRRYGTKQTMNQKEMSGSLAPLGSSITMIVANVV